MINIINKRRMLQTGMSQAELCRSRQLRHVNLETHQGGLNMWVAMPNINGVPEAKWLRVSYIIKEIKPNLLVLESFVIYDGQTAVTMLATPYNPWAVIEARCIANFEDIRALNLN